MNTCTAVCLVETAFINTKYYWLVYRFSLFEVSVAGQKKRLSLVIITMSGQLSFNQTITDHDNKP